MKLRRGSWSISLCGIHLVVEYDWSTLSRKMSLNAEEIRMIDTGLAVVEVESGRRHAAEVPVAVPVVVGLNSQLAVKSPECFYMNGLRRRLMILDPRSSKSEIGPAFPSAQ